MNNKYFFFKDCAERDRTVEYVKKYCKEEFDHVMKTADNVCNNVFSFDLRWDMERSQKPVVFKDKIDWLKLPGDDGEWIYAFNRHKYWICLGQAYAATKDEKYVKAFIGQLESWVTTMGREKCENAPVWRTIEAGLRMEYWLKAFCYFEDSPLITDKVKALFYKSMTDHAEFILSVWNSYNLMSNWGQMANHGLFIAGVMLPETWKDLDGKIQHTKNSEYINTALSRLEQEARIQIYDDGVQWEQAPMYHNEVLHHYLDVLILAQRNNIKIADDVVEKIHAMCTADVIWEKPNGEELCMGDSDAIDVRDLTTKGALLFKDSFIKSRSYEKLDYETVWDVGADQAEVYESIPAENAAHKTLESLPASGNFFFRSSQNSDALFFHFHCGTLGAGHGHSDQLHVDLFANGEDILIDGGRFTYVDKKERYDFKDSTGHNTCTVDGKNIYKCVDSWGCDGLVRSLNRNAASKNGFNYIEGGYIKDGLFVNRRCIFIEPDILVINDEFYAKENHSYQQYWHFAPQIKVEKSGEDRWLGTGNTTQTEIVSVIADKNAIPLNYDYKANIIDGEFSPHYNAKVPTKVVKAEWKAKGFSSQWTVISVNKMDCACTNNGKKATSDFEKITVESVPVLSNFKNGYFPRESIEAVKISKGKKEYTVVIAHKEYASPTDTFCAGGITWDDLAKQNIREVIPGNKAHQGVFTAWGAVNGDSGCTGFGEIVIFDNSKGEKHIGTVLKN